MEKTIRRAINITRLYDNNSSNIMQPWGLDNEEEWLEQYSIGWNEILFLYFRNTWNETVIECIRTDSTTTGMYDQQKLGFIRTEQYKIVYDMWVIERNEIYLSYNVVQLENTFWKYMGDTRIQLLAYNNQSHGRTDTGGPAVRFGES